VKEHDIVVVFKLLRIIFNMDHRIHFPLPDPKKSREKIVEEPVFPFQFSRKEKKNARHVETENHLAIQHLSTVKTCCIYREKSDTLAR
jgi:hypothetical protein